jgi:hypothetical protein
MKYILGIAGLMLLATALSMNKVSAWGVECYFFGSRPNLNSSCISPNVFLGFLIIGAVLLIAAAVLTAIEFSKAPQSSDRWSVSNNPSPSAIYVPQQPTALQNKADTSAPTASSPAWKTLKEFDEDVRTAAEQIAPLGLQAEERLASAFMAVSDKSLLGAMVSKISEDEERKRADIEAARIKKEEDIKKRTASLSDRQIELIADREQRARFTIDRIKDAGMVYGGKRVKSAEIFYGEQPADQGWAKIVYEDGTAELRAGASFTTINYP